MLSETQQFYDMRIGLLVKMDIMFPSIGESGCFRVRPAAFFVVMYLSSASVSSRA